MTRGDSSRRDLLRALGAGAAAAAVPLAHAGARRPGSAASRPASDPLALSTCVFGPWVWCRVGGQPFTCYRATTAQKYPYFYPVLGPATGLPMTEEAGELYPHHRSLFLGCDRVNGGNYWQEGLDRGQIVSRGPSATISGRTIVIEDECDWRLPGNDPIIQDRRRWTLSAPSADQRIIDADITLQALAGIQVAQTNHSLFAIRAAAGLTPAGGGQLLDSEGRSGEKATFGQTASWCGFQGNRLGQIESLVLMDHPRNPWSPCRWFTRDYGFASPTPFNWLGAEGWKLPKGESVRLRYRVVVAAGPVDRNALRTQYDAFAET